ncbi:hypothetical protein [Hymenobacter sp. 102]|uniref:hypothetical protein n=1 Tax=Hymenobacter sp. 102 TaxID=3403152 RepID=UPI003CFB5250
MLRHFRPINWRLLLLHFLATFLLIMGARQLYVIPYVSFLEVYQRDGIEAMQKASGQSIGQLTFDLVAAPLYARFAAVLISCLLSALVVWHRRESKLIPVLLFVSTIISGRTGYEKSSYVHTALAFLRSPLEAEPKELGLAVVGGILILLGLLLFLLTWRRPQAKLDQSFASSHHR